jgi:hypothetical protein
VTDNREILRRSCANPIVGSRGTSASVATPVAPRPLQRNPETWLRQVHLSAPAARRDWEADANAANQPCASPGKPGEFEADPSRAR